MSLLKLKTKEAKKLPDNCHDSDDNVISHTNTSNSNYTNGNDKSENSEEPDEFPTLTLRMLNFCREFTIFCLVMMVYAAFSKDPPKISKSPAAYRFFAENSIVTDWYRGHISKAIESARNSDVAFVMFYAPWDADSQNARHEFEVAAEFLQDRVKFVAVNCWQPQGECRTQYNKVYKWPVLIAYLPHGRGIQYNGPLRAPHMIEFLNKVCQPIRHLGKESVRDFQDAYVKVELNASPGSRDFAVLYTAALKYLEKDPQYRIAFYVSPAKVSKPSMRLFLWNETLVFPIGDKPWLPDEILQWIIKHTHQVTSWVLPSGTKSMVLSNTIQNGASLILFTPRNPLHINIDYYNLLQEIAQEYFLCEDDTITNMLTVHLKLRRAANTLIHKQLQTMCNINSKISTQKVLSNLKTVWTNASYCSQAKCKDCDTLTENTVRKMCANMKTEQCLELYPRVNKDSGCKSKSKFLDDVEYLKSSSEPEFGDYRSSDNLKSTYLKDKCKLFLAAQKVHPALFAKSISPQRNISLAGLSCKTNKTLVFLAMDSLLHYKFAEKLGIDLSKQPDRSAAVILNDKLESHFVLQQSINRESLKEFILNYTESQLNRSFDSMSTLSAPPEQAENKSKVFVKELNTDTFLSTVLRNDKSVIVFYYSKQCSFCNGVSYVYLTVAKKMSLVKNLVFTRINGEINVLPWEYTMGSYPTILFFPTRRKSESRVFPSGIPISVSNLINFLLANLEPNLKLQAIWSVCIQTKLAHRQAHCYSRLLGETLNLIETTLREWRKSEKLERQIILRRLKSLRQLHLLFAHTPKNHSDVLNSLNRFNSNLQYTGNYLVSQNNGMHDEL
ncbi:unnamed protein product [Phyllotreta striolata]|uniref:Thioredoxin domain-containing protein n=1 Tax=Phyllotreta striolata TaxID=444603 RepID=A0A9N9THV5_PHYSR|nr:unnamed protein product [Phyllotreta striolata]